LRLNINKHHLKTGIKVLGYTTMAMILTTEFALATLDDQVDKATDLVLGKVAPLVIGGATLFGGGVAALNGKPYEAIAILGVGGIIGIGIALAKSGAIFNVLG
jgi:D-arabinose 1-dehydrogenase-like Zn-dependent alcohol dehydrogenase